MTAFNLRSNSELPSRLSEEAGQRRWLHATRTHLLVGATAAAAEAGEGAAANGAETPGGLTLLASSSVLPLGAEPVHNQSALATILFSPVSIRRETSSDGRAIYRLIAGGGAWLI